MANPIRSASYNTRTGWQVLTIALFIGLCASVVGYFFSIRRTIFKVEYIKDKTKKTFIDPKQYAVQVIIKPKDEDHLIEAMRNVFLIQFFLKSYSLHKAILILDLSDLKPNIANSMMRTSWSQAKYSLSNSIAIGFTKRKYAKNYTDGLAVIYKNTTVSKPKNIVLGNIDNLVEENIFSDFLKEMIFYMFDIKKGVFSQEK